MRRFTSTALACLGLLIVQPIMVRADEAAGRTTETRVKREVIPFRTQFIFNREITPGRARKVTNGVNGERVTTVTRTLEAGRVIDSQTRVETRPAKAAVFHMSRAGFQLTDRSSFTRTRRLTMQSTAYTPSCGGGHGITASGLRAQFGVIAVDPRVIPIGTLVFVEGYGFAVAADTGGAIRGNIIDVCVPTRQEAMRWGRREVTVHIFEGRHTRGMRGRHAR